MVTNPVPSRTSLASSGSRDARATPRNCGPGLATTARRACPIEMPFRKSALPDNQSAPRLLRVLRWSYSVQNLGWAVGNGASHGRNHAAEISLKSRPDFTRASRGVGLKVDEVNSRGRSIGHWRGALAGGQMIGMIGKPGGAGGGTAAQGNPHRLHQGRAQTRPAAGGKPVEGPHGVHPARSLTGFLSRHRNQGFTLGFHIPALRP